MANKKDKIKNTKNNKTKDTKNASASQKLNAKVSKKSSAIKSLSNKADAQAWTEGKVYEKAAFIGSIIFLIVSIVFLVFEFTLPNDSWPYTCFDFAISFAFICETIARWRFNRKLSIITGICGGLFLILGLLKLFSILQM